MYCLGRQDETTARTSSWRTLTPGKLSATTRRSFRVRFFKLLQRETFLSQWCTPGRTYSSVKRIKHRTQPGHGVTTAPRIMPYSLSWSLLRSRQRRSSCRTCCCGEQVFFNLSRLLRSTLRPGRLSSSLSNGTDDSRSEDSD